VSHRTRGFFLPDECDADQLMGYLAPVYCECRFPSEVGSFRLSILELGFLVMGRRLLLVARVVRPEDASMWAVLEEAYDDARNRDTRTRVVQTWNEFLRLNNLDRNARALKLFVGQMLNSGMKIGSVHTYVRYIAKGGDLPRSNGDWRRVVSLVSLAHADAETRKAPRISVRDAMRIVAWLYGDVAKVVAGIVTTGARCADVMRWMPGRVEFGKNHFVVDVHVTKNRRDPDKRVVHRMPDVRKMLGFPVPEVLLDVRRYPPFHRPFAGWHATRVNQALVAACKALDLPRVTTYSFRRLYCQRVLEFFDFDSCLAKRYTLHCRAEVLAAFYDDANIQE
jgi:hypothetical protein